MFSKLKEAVEISMNALAPSPPLHEDFVFHWKKFMKHYLNLSLENKAAVELTNLPDCLDRLREILVNEDHEIQKTANNTEVGPCMEYLLKHRLLDLLVCVAIFDEPPGMKTCILHFFSKTLTQINEPNIAHSAIYIPLMKLMNVCDGLLHSVSEIQEIEFLLHLCSILRKQPAVTVMFFSEESAQYLTEITENGDSIKYKNILDLVLSYVDSADTNIRIKACQCVLLLCSTSDDVIARHIVRNVKFNHFLIGRLITLFYEIPPDDYDKFKNIRATWTLDVTLNTDLTIANNRQAIIFFCWLDFIDQLCLECHSLIKENLRQCVTNNFLQEAFHVTFSSCPETVAVFHKYYSSLTSTTLLLGFQDWLRTFGAHGDILEITNNKILQDLVNNCISENEILAEICLEFFVEVLNKFDEKILYSLIFCYLKDRLYYDVSAGATSWSDEEDERLKYSSSPESLSSSRTLVPSNIDKIIQSFINIVPAQVRIQDAAENIEDLRNEYEQVLARCAQFDWPKEAISDVECISNDSNPEVDSHYKPFYEGPFLRMIFDKIKNMPQLSSSQMSLVICIILKLAILPHPFLHEYLLNPSLPLRKGVTSLYFSLYYAANKVSSRVLAILDYQNELKAMRQKIRSKDEYVRKRNETDGYLESCVLLEELCNHLAATAYMKYVYLR